VIYYAGPDFLDRVIKKLKSNGYLTYAPAEWGWFEVNGYFKEPPTPPPVPPKHVLRKTPSLILRVRGSRFEYVEPDRTPVALIGIRPCDAFALEILHGVSMFSPTLVNEKLNNLFMVVEECANPSPTCFCSDAGTGPDARVGDIAYIRLRNGFLVRPLSERGKAVLVSIGVDELAPKEVLEEYYDIISRTARKARIDPSPHMSTDKLKQASWEDWEKASENCAGCGSCSISCPTCFCFDIREIHEGPDEGGRAVVWDTCLSLYFAAMASHNPREKIPARLRQFVMHKLVWWREQFGTTGCVGCGRCTFLCPFNVGIITAVKEVVKK
jgi:sulfhydrogenase subunit beta (sulfur reductase)